MIFDGDNQCQPEQVGHGMKDDLAASASQRVALASEISTTTINKVQQEDQNTEAATEAMDASDAPPDNSGSGGGRARKPTLKQQKWAAAMAVTNGNQTAAARLAGYRGNRNVLAGIGHDNARNPKVQQLTANLMQPMVARAVECVGEAMDATTSRSFLTRDGNIVSTDAVADHKTRMRAATFVLDRAEPSSACAIPSGDQVSDNAAAEEQVDEGDRVLLEQAAAINEALTRLDAAAHEHEDGHDA